MHIKSQKRFGIMPFISSLPKSELLI